MDTNKKVKRPWFSLFLVGLLLVILPAISPIISRFGSNYRKNIKDELLVDLGKVDNFNGTPVNWKPISMDSLKDRLLVVNIVKKDGQQSEQQKEIMGKLHEQFADSKLIYFLSLIEGADSLQAANYLQNQNIKKNFNYFVFYGNDEVKKNWLSSFKYIQKGDFSNAENPYFAFVDKDLTIRGFYDVNNAESIKRFVEHIALKNMEKKAKPEIIRDKER